MKKILIGIDPDVDKNGVASNDGTNVDLLNLTYFELFEYMKAKQETYDHLLVFVEAGWLNKSNWHKKEGGSAALNAKIGSYTGANHETGKKICEMLDYLKIPYKEIKPTKSKVNARTFEMLTKFKGRYNQEQRDAYMLIHGLTIKN